MRALNTAPNIAKPDDIYQALIDLHKDRSDADSQKVNAKLILLLANHIGDADVLAEAIDAAGRSVDVGAPGG